MNKFRALAAGVAAIGLVLATPTLASAGSEPPPPVVKSSALAAPFNIAFYGRTVYVADGGLNLVGTLAGDGSITTVAADQAGASGVARSWDGRTIAFTTTATDEGTFTNTASGLNLWGPGGKQIYADTLAYENANNPDGNVHYGFDSPGTCTPDDLAALGAPTDYMGGIDSHAYSVTPFGWSWIVADAGANVLWRIDRNGSVHTLSVLPRQEITLSADMVAQLELPSCMTGLTYAFESVPTDVELGLDGQLYVSLLPGGPEGPQLGARGAVYKVNPFTGASKWVAGGFAGATNLAVGWHGEIYVAELFGGQISVVKNGATSVFASLPGVVAVETNLKGEVWAATLGDQDSQTPGTIVKVSDGPFQGYFGGGH